MSQDSAAAAASQIPAAPWTNIYSSKIQSHPNSLLATPHIPPSLPVHPLPILMLVRHLPRQLWIEFSPCTILPLLVIVWIVDNRLKKK